MMNKKFVTRLLIFTIILIAADRLIGLTFNKLYFTSNDKSIAKLRYTIDSTRQDIIILGSSRAQHHFNPSVIAKETGLSAYNCGFGGQGLAFSFVQLSEMTKRYHPKLVILEVSPEILLDPESEDKLRILLPYANRDTLIRNILTRNNPLENVKLLSEIYPYNSKIINLLKALSQKPSDPYNGYYPLDRQIDTTQKIVINSFKTSNGIAEDKFYYLDRISNLCNEKNIPLFITISPYYSVNQDLMNLNDQIASRCELNRLNFENYSSYPETYHKPMLFQDNAHLNDTGADLFSSAISKKISLYFSNDYSASL